MENDELLDNKIYENLPDVIKNLTSSFIGREKDVVLLSTLGVLSAAIPKVYGIYDSKKIYSNLYIMIIAPPASGKGVMNYSRALLEPIHSDGLRSSEIEREGNAQTPLELKIIPANTSSAELYNHLKNAKNGALIIESEADTLSVMLKNDWGNFSDVLRKAFHHENVSITRKVDKWFIEIENPKLSLVLSGTPDQIQPLVNSKDNGLFSRFCYYTFNGDSNWKDVFATKIDYSKKFHQTGLVKIKAIYERLLGLEEEIEFRIPMELEIEFNKRMSYIHSLVVKEHPKVFNSNVKRHGVIFFRLCMILTVIRNYDQIKPSEIIYCNKIDFDIAYRITENLLHHAREVLTMMGENSLSSQDEELLKNLEKQFTRAQIQEIGKKMDIPERTIDEKLKQFMKLKYIKKQNRGNYQKLIM